MNLSRINYTLAGKTCSIALAPMVGDDPNTLSFWVENGSSHELDLLQPIDSEALSAAITWMIQTAAKRRPRRAEVEMIYADVQRFVVQAGGAK